MVGGTFVGGSSTGWEIADPYANAAALGLVPGAAAQPAAAMPIYGGGALSFGASALPITGSGYDPYTAAGMVGGSWSPEPAGNNQILYGHYSATGQLSVPQAMNGLHAASAMPMTAGMAPAGGGQAPKPDAKPATPAADKKPEAKTVTVKAGDSLSAIAASKGISWQKLYEANKDVVGSNPNLIRPGQVLKLP